MKDGDRMCLEADFELVGIKATRVATIYGDNGLKGIMFSVARFDGTSLSEALTRKYGVPCITRTDTVQNGFGATFERDTLRWCFSDGVASFKSIGSKIDRADFSFTTLETRDALVIDF